MDFVDDVDLESGLGRHEDDFIADPPDIVDTVVGGGVHFDDVKQAAVEHTAADGALVAGVAVLRIQAVDRPGENLGQSGLAGAARAAEQVGMGDLAADHGLAQGIDGMLLLDDFVEDLGRHSR